MRKQTHFEAYLDTFNEVNIYFSTQCYGGMSDYFYIEDEEHNQIRLEIIDERLEEGFIHYTCQMQDILIFGKQYKVFHEHARSTPLLFVGVVKEPQFDNLFTYNAQDLGATYHSSETLFKVWAPTAYNVWLELEGEMHKMQREDKGVYCVRVEGDLLKKSYLYYVEVNGKINKTQDPYAIASTANSLRSVVVERKQRVSVNCSDVMESNCDAVLYEMSVRDYASQRNFKSLISDNILEYVKELGISHVQLLPVTDFGSVDDLDIDRHYNWGYDPVGWMALENSYSSDVHNPEQIMEDFASFVSRAHQLNVRVNVDVVFNHVYDMGQSAMEQCVPYYYFQYTKEWGFGNSSYCGNDVDSQRSMCRKLIVDACLFLLNTYQIDGLRFDLMGILDVDTMNEIAYRCKRIKKDFMIYGEGWNMPSYVPEGNRASIQNQAKMPQVAHFSNRFRDVVKGGTIEHDSQSVGYMLGDLSKVYACMNVFGASTQNVGDYILFDSPQKCINYVECHDNQTSFDKIQEVLQVDDATKLRYHKLLLASVILAQGVVFIHGGEEFARTKQGLHNTYNAPDSINKIDFSLQEKNKDMIEYVKTLLAIRKQYPCFRKKEMKEIHSSVYYEAMQGTLLKYRIFDDYDEFEVLFNPSQSNVSYSLPKGYVLIFDGDVQCVSREEIVDIKAVSVIILHKSIRGDYEI